MSIYTNQDLSIADDGDLNIENGDLVVASAADSIKSYLLTWSLATRGTFLTDPDVGWGAEGFINRPNIPNTHTAMQKDLGYSYSQAPDLNLSDLIYAASYVDRDVAAVTVAFSGTVIEPDGSSPSTGLVLGFSFPFNSGKIQQEVQN